MGTLDRKRLYVVTFPSSVVHKRRVIFMHMRVLPCLLLVLPLLAQSRLALAQAAVFSPVNPSEYAAGGPISIDHGFGAVSHMNLGEVRKATINQSLLTTAATAGPGTLVSLNLFDDATYQVRFVSFQYIHVDPALDPNASMVWFGTVEAPDEGSYVTSPSGTVALSFESGGISGVAYFRQRRFYIGAIPDEAGKVFIAEFTEPEGTPSPAEPVVVDEQYDLNPPLPPAPVDGKKTLRVLIARGPKARTWTISAPFAPFSFSFNTFAEYQALIQEMDYWVRKEFGERNFPGLLGKMVGLAAVIDIPSQDVGGTMLQTWTTMGNNTNLWFGNWGDPNRADLIQYQTFFDGDERYVCGITAQRGWWGVVNRYFSCQDDWTVIHELGHSLDADHDPEANSEASIQRNGAGQNVFCVNDGSCAPGFFCQEPAPGAQKLCRTRGRGWYSSSFKFDGEDRWITDVMGYHQWGCTNRVGPQCFLGIPGLFCDQLKYHNRCWVRPFFSSTAHTIALPDQDRGVRGQTSGGSTQDNIGRMMTWWPRMVNWRPNR